MSERRSTRLTAPAARESMKTKFNASLKGQASVAPPAQDLLANEKSRDTQLKDLVTVRMMRLRFVVTRFFVHTLPRRIPSQVTQTYTHPNQHTQNWMSIGNDDFLPVVRAAFNWVSHKRAMINTVNDRVRAAMKQSENFPCLLPLYILFSSPHERIIPHAGVLPQPSFL